MLIEHDPAQSTFWAEQGGERARLHYDLEDGVLDIRSTFTPPALRGRGIARKLVEKAAAYARGGGFRLEASCSFARHVLDQDA